MLHLDARVPKALAEPAGDEHEGRGGSLTEANLLEGAEIRAPVGKVLALLRKKCAEAF